VVQNTFTPVSELGPAGIFADGASNFYLAVQGNGNTIFPNITAVSAGRATISPNSGYTGGSGLTKFEEPTGIAIDQSGNAWVVNLDNWNNNSNSVSTSYRNSNGVGYLGSGSGCGTLTEVIGLAVPVQPVLSLDAKAGGNGLTTAGAYGVKP
jgi:hypothetical protein